MSPFAWSRAPVKNRSESLFAEKLVLVLAGAAVMGALALNLYSGAAFEDVTQKGAPLDRRAGPLEVRSTLRTEWSWGRPTAVLEIQVVNASNTVLSQVEVRQFEGQGLRLDPDCFPPGGLGPVCSTADPSTRVELPTTLKPHERLSAAGRAWFKEGTDLASGRFAVHWQDEKGTEHSEDFMFPGLPGPSSKRAWSRAGYVVFKDVGLAFAIAVLPFFLGLSQRRGGQREGKIAEEEALRRVLLPQFARDWRRFYAPIVDFCGNLATYNVSSVRIKGWVAESPEGVEDVPALRELFLYLCLEGRENESATRLGGWTLRTRPGEELVNDVWNCFVRVADHWLLPDTREIGDYLRVRRFMMPIENTAALQDEVERLVAGADEDSDPRLPDALRALQGRFAAWKAASLADDLKLLGLVRAVLVHEANRAFSPWYEGEGDPIEPTFLQAVQAIEPDRILAGVDTDISRAVAALCERALDYAQNQVSSRDVEMQVEALQKALVTPKLDSAPKGETAKEGPPRG